MMRDRNRSSSATVAPMERGGRGSRRRAVLGAMVALALGLLAAPADAQRGKGGGSEGGGGTLPAEPNVAYNTRKDIVLLDTVTGESGVLGTDGHAPAWSPDGSRIAYLRIDHSDLVIQSSDGSGPPQVVTTITNPQIYGRIDWGRAPTPNGRHMLLYPEQIDPAGFWSICAIGTDGTDKVELVQADALSLEEPRWSPAGDRFLYTSFSGPVGQTVVCTVGLVDGQLAVVAAEPLPISSFERDWSNDGDWIVVRASEELWLIDARDFTNVRQLTFTPNDRERWPTFDATDSRIFFIIDDRNRDQLYSIDSSTGGDLRLESGIRGVYKPQCRRDA